MAAVPPCEVDPEFQFGGLHCVNFCRVLTYLIRTAIMSPLPMARLIITTRKVSREILSQEQARVDGITHKVSRR